MDQLWQRVEGSPGSVAAGLLEPGRGDGLPSPIFVLECCDDSLPTRYPPRAVRLAWWAIDEYRQFWELPWLLPAWPVAVFYCGRSRSLAIHLALEEPLIATGLVEAITSPLRLVFRNLTICCLSHYDVDLSRALENLPDLSAERRRELLSVSAVYRALERQKITLTCPDLLEGLRS